MATPDVLPLRSPFGFMAATREEILGEWDRNLAEHKVNVAYKSEVTGIKGEKGQFEISLGNGDKVTAENIVLAIGLQGNIRRLLERAGGPDAEASGRRQYHIGRA